MRAYQVADNNFAFADGASGLGWSRLACIATSGLCVLLDASDGRGLDWAARGAADRSSPAGVVTSLSREDLVERLVKLARHVDGSGGWW